jgi:hypothetical protein
VDNVLVHQDGSEESKRIVMAGERLGGLKLSSQDFGVSNVGEPSGFTTAEK